jgi:mannose-6-phosphate isomerase class I
VNLNSDEGRKSPAFMLPLHKPSTADGKYDIYPTHILPDNLIFTGFESLARIFSEYQSIVIEGYAGIFYEIFREGIDDLLKKYCKKTAWTDVTRLLKPSRIIDDLIAPDLGGDDPVFGRRTDLELSDFFLIEKFKDLKPDPEADINLIYGPGSSLSGWNGLLVYIDLPKNEIQFRSRAGSIKNIGACAAADPKSMYKRFFFVDWIVLNRHRKAIQHKVDIFVDGQRPNNPVWITGESLRSALHDISRSIFRVRPWFEPGTWGGTWIKDNINGLTRDVPNYAWSFELIVPENGLLLESSGIMLEMSFDVLMYQEAASVLGDCFDRFQTDFPIRFDFLDTFDGGNLSIQCHPRPCYIKKHFGEPFTQEETYYILDRKEDSVVYLGFREDIQPDQFREALERSFNENIPVKIEDFVLKHSSSKHDLFLIPSGTIHGSGKNNLVLEISSTPYIYTFKMYDWLRPDLDGKPRPLNISRGMDNLDFERKGSYVAEKLISHPELLCKTEDYELWHLPTHETQLYDVHRYLIRSSAEVETGNKFHVLSLVEGKSISVETGNGAIKRFSFAETFVIPAAAGKYRIINDSTDPVIVVKAFVK